MAEGREGLCSATGHFNRLRKIKKYKNYRIFSGVAKEMDSTLCDSITNPLFKELHVYAEVLIKILKKFF